MHYSVHHGVGGHISPTGSVEMTLTAYEVWKHLMSRISGIQLFYHKLDNMTFISFTSLRRTPTFIPEGILPSTKKVEEGVCVKYFTVATLAWRL